MTYSTSRCQGKREHKQEQYYSCADTANKDISRTRAVQPKETPAKQNTTHKWTSHADIAEYGTKMSIYIFQKQEKTGRDSSNVNPQVAEPGESGRPF